MSKTIPIALKDDEAVGLYQAERKVYPRDVHGRYDRLRRIAVVVLLGMYYVFRGCPGTAARPCCSICRRASSRCSA